MIGVMPERFDFPLANSDDFWMPVVRTPELRQRGISGGFMAFGRLTAGIGAVLYWVTNPFWVGGSLCFTATAAWSDNIHPVGSGTFGDYLFKFSFIWISIGVAIVSLKRGKWIPNAGAIARHR